MTSVVDNITGLFGRGFITAGLLPIWVAGCCAAGLLAAAIGIDGLVSWVLLRPVRSLIVLATLAMTLLLLMAVVLRAARAPILAFFSGENWLLTITGISAVLVLLERRRSRQMLRNARTEMLWTREPDRVRALFVAASPPRPLAPTTLPEVPQLLEEARIAALTAAGGTPVDRQTYNDLLNRLLPLFGEVVDAALTPIVERLIELAETMALMERYYGTAAWATWLEQFGPRGIVRCTRLGNRLLAIDAYPYRRYQMEGSILWPHIQQLADDALREDIGAHRVQLEMVLANAMIFLLLAIVTAMIGPWLALHWFIWLTAAVVFGALSWLFYRSGIMMADALGKTLCVACDLVRQDILRKMGFQVPADLPAERAQWVEVSRLVAFGDGMPTFTPPAP
jgi:hypothetical protein